MFFYNNNNKQNKNRKLKIIFLTTILSFSVVANVFSVSSSSSDFAFLKDVKALETSREYNSENEYEYENDYTNDKNYYYSYDQYKPKPEMTYGKSSGPAYQNVKCDNTNAISMV